MEITKELIRNKFKELNARLFDGELVTPRIEIKKTFRFIGNFQCNFKPQTKEMTCPKITLSENYIKWDEQLFTNILAHEMIHLYLAQTNSVDRKMHGRNFKRKMRELNEKYSLNINIKESEAPLTEEAEKYWKYIAENDKTNILLKILLYIPLKLFAYDW